MMKHKQQIHLQHVLPQQHILNVSDQSRYAVQKTLHGQTASVYYTDFQRPHMLNLSPQSQEISFKEPPNSVSLGNHSCSTSRISPSFQQNEQNLLQIEGTEVHAVTKPQQQIKTNGTVELQQQYLLDLNIKKEYETSDAPCQVRDASFVNKNEQNLGSTFSSVSNENSFQFPNFFSADEAACVKIEIGTMNVDSEQINETKGVSSLDDQFSMNFKKNIEMKGGLLSDLSVKLNATNLENVASNDLSSLDVEYEEKNLTCEPASNEWNAEPSKKIFNYGVLEDALMPTLEILYEQKPASLDFQQPVDPLLLKIPDYFDIIKNPMDLSTIKQKLENGKYQDPWQYVEDVWLMFENAWLYNRKTSRVYKNCSKLAEVFVQEIVPVMQSIGFCCGQKYIFQSEVLYCQNNHCIIGRGDRYWSYDNRYIYCQKCFAGIHHDTITFRDEYLKSWLSIRKNHFVELTNSESVKEPFVECLECGRRLHQICVLYLELIWPEGFVCNNCLKERGEERRKNIFTSQRLQHSKLGLYVENRVNNFLKWKGVSKRVVIRVLSNSKKIVEVKPQMKARFVDNGIWPKKFPYRAKSLFAFQEIDGVDVCFFGMHVQEYDSDCPSPNKRHVYLAYLDSVHFFQPKQYRTDVYHEILLGYLDYVKKLGYSTVYVWACPPRGGEDYIFHCHSTEQKVPTPKRLKEWYKKLFDKAIMEGIVIDYKNILQNAVDYNLESAADLPYFEGDLWPLVLEDSIKELSDEKEAVEAIPTNSSDLMKFSKKGSKLGVNKKWSRNKNNPKKRRRLNNYVGNDLCAKIYSTMEKYKEIFFVIRLHTAQDMSLRPIIDPDPLIISELMDTRDAFLCLCRDNHYEFSSLRRAKFSTMAFLYELHIQGQVTCNLCNKNVEARYHCTTCDDFDLCRECFKKDGHDHKMEKVNFTFSQDNELSHQTRELNKRRSQQCIMKYTESMNHAHQCSDTDCKIPMCIDVKIFLRHLSRCPQDKNACKFCHYFLLISYGHIKSCKERKCLVKICVILRLRRLKGNDQMPNRIGVVRNDNLGTLPAASTSYKPIVSHLQSSQQMQVSSAVPSTSARYHRNEISNPSTIQQIKQDKVQASVFRRLPNVSDPSLAENDTGKEKINCNENSQSSSGQQLLILRNVETSDFMKNTGAAILNTSARKYEVACNFQNKNMQKVPKTVLKFINIAKTSASVEQQEKVSASLKSYICSRNADLKLKLQHLSSKSEQQHISVAASNVQSLQNSQQPSVLVPTASDQSLEFLNDPSELQSQSQQILKAVKSEQMTSSHSVFHPQQGINTFKEPVQLSLKPQSIQQLRVSYAPLNNQVCVVNSSQPVISSKITPVLQQQTFPINSSQRVISSNIAPVLQNQSLPVQQFTNSDLHNTTQTQSLHPDMFVVSSGRNELTENESTNNVCSGYNRYNPHSSLHASINPEFNRLCDGRMSSYLTREELLCKVVEYL